MKIGIDIMGGDFAPEKTVIGAVKAANELSKDTSLVLFGHKSEIFSQLNKLDSPPLKEFEIVHCEETITMEEHATKAYRSKPESSIAKGFEYLKNGNIDGFASAGNTGAIFVGSVYAVKTAPGVLRPPLSTLIPRANGGSTVLLDVGANVDCKPDVLYQFGILGSLFSKHVCGIKNPKVALLNVGEEKCKGNVISQNTYSLMENNQDFEFIGNCEGRDIFSSEIDVIVCDGFTGNIVLKEAEGIYEIMKERNLLDDFFDRLNYEDYGGTPILGLNKPVIIGHGISNETAIKNMILLTENIITADLANKIKNNIKS
jgi:glycerol-3-phosphate acyltransferase PlsX|tara:strand:- start:620 stop:1564 length:945 start_codon:yes stop_codon:yes gene_type:complete